MYKISNHFADNLLQLRYIREVLRFRLLKYHVDWMKILYEKTCFKHMHIKETFYDITSFSRDSNMPFNVNTFTRLTLLLYVCVKCCDRKEIVSTN